MPLINNLEEYIKTLEILPAFQKTLADIPNEDYTLDVMDINETITIDKKPIQFIGSLITGPKIFVFNDPGDNTRDVEEFEHDLISTENSDEEVQIVPNYDTHAIIQYGLGVSVKAGASLEKFGFSFSGSAKARVATYKQHPRTYSLLKASVLDLKSFPWIFNLDEVKNLKNNEACSLEFAGELKSSLEVSWSDLYSGSLMGISKMLKVAAPLTVEVDAGATVQFDFGIQDDFVLVIKKVSGTKFEVGVKKNKKQSLGAGAKIGVSATLVENSQGALEKILESLLEQYLKKSKNEIAQILSKASKLDLSPEELAILQIIMDSIGFSGVTDKIEEIKVEWEKHLEKIRETIRKIATSKIEVGINYEYSQIKTENCFLLGEFSDTALEKHHSDLIKFNLKSILKDGNDGVTIKKYLEEKSYIRKNGFGFDLKFGQKGVGLDIENSVEILIRKNEKDGFLHLSSKSAKSYEGRFFGESFKWIAGLHAETKNFVYDPTISDLDFKQHLGLEWSESKKLEKNEIYKIIDTSVLWGLINGYDRDAAYARLSEELKTKKAKNIQVTLKLEIPEDTFKEIIRTMYEVKTKNLKAFYSNFAFALAASMFNRNDSIRDRIEKHGTNFLNYLTSPNSNLSEELKPYANLINPSQIGQLTNAIDMIIKRGGETFSEDALKKIIKAFNKFHNNVYRVKVLGFMMLHFARIAGRADEIEPTLKITYSQGKDEKVINMVQNLDPLYLNY